MKTHTWPEEVTKSLVDFIFNPADFGKQLVLAVQSPAQLAIESATVQVLSEIGRPDDPWRMPGPKIRDLIRLRESAVMGCGAEVRSQLNTSLEEGYERGETTAELADGSVTCSTGWRSSKRNGSR